MTANNPLYISEQDAALNCAAGRHEWSLFGEGPAAFCLHCAATRRNVNAPVITAPKATPPASDAARLLTGGQLGIMDVAIAEDEIWDWTSETLPKPGDNNYLEYHQWRHDIALLEKAGYLQCMPRSIAEPWHWIPTRKYAAYLKQQPPASNGTTAGERAKVTVEDWYMAGKTAGNLGTPVDEALNYFVKQGLTPTDQQRGEFELGWEWTALHEKHREQPAPRPPSKAVKLTKHECELLRLVKTGSVRTHAGSIRETELRNLENDGLMYQGRHSYWYLTDLGRETLAALRNADEEARK